MKTLALSAVLLLASLAVAQTSRPVVREYPGAKDVIAADQSLYLFVRYEGGQVVEMILTNIPATVEQDGARLKVMVQSPTGARFSYGGMRGLLLLRIQPDGRVHSTINKLPALADDPAAGFEKATKETGQDLPAYLATREDFKPLLAYMTAPPAERPAQARPGSRPAQAGQAGQAGRAGRAEVPKDPTAELTDALRAGARSLQRVRLALEKKPDLAATNSRGEPFIYQAARGGDPDIVWELIKAGVDVNAATAAGETALYAAVRVNNIGVARVLLENGADPNAVARNGWTPLGLAAFSSQFQMVRTLLAFKADPNLACREKSPLDWATMQPNNDEVVNAIREAVAGKAK